MSSSAPLPETPPISEHLSTLEAARILGLAVRSVQLMVDRGDLDAWKTPGGHRRITRVSVDRWRTTPRKANSGAEGGAANRADGPSAGEKDGRTKVLLIEDSVHFQNLVTLLLRQQFPDLSLHVAGDGISGLVMAGKLQPEILMVDILLPGIDGAALIGSLRSHPQFSDSQLIVITSLDTEQLKPYAFALQNLPVVHKPRLIADLPPLLTQAVARLQTLAYQSV
jgi:excisionase family DNA binding protein